MTPESTGDRVKWACQVRWALKESEASQDHKEDSDRAAAWVQRVQRECRANRAPAVSLASLVQWVRRVNREIREDLVTWASKDVVAIGASVVHQDSRAASEILDRAERPEYPELTEFLAHRALLVSLVELETTAPEVSQDLRAHLVLPVSWELEVPAERTELTAHLDRREAWALVAKKVYQVPMEREVLTVQWGREV